MTRSASPSPVRRPVYKAIHRPLTICGVDRRLLFLALLMGAATFNLFYSFPAGLLVFGALFLAEPIHPEQVIGGAVILTGVAVARRGPLPPGRAIAVPSAR